MKKGFTLLEVLLSTAVMASGVLTVVILYSLGFRETRQSNDDVASASYADAVLSPMVNALSATNIAWSVFREIKNSPAEGWKDYYDGNWRISSGWKSTANSAISEVMKVGTTGVKTPNLDSSEINGGLKVAGVVVRHEKGDSVVKICFRAARSEKMLMTAPMYYTEVHFQGDPEK